MLLIAIVIVLFAIVLGLVLVRNVDVNSVKIKICWWRIEIEVEKAPFKERTGTKRGKLLRERMKAIYIKSNPRSPQSFRSYFGCHHILATKLILPNPPKPPQTPLCRLGGFVGRL